MSNDLSKIDRALRECESFMVNVLDRDDYPDHRAADENLLTMVRDALAAVRRERARKPPVDTRGRADRNSP